MATIAENLQTIQNIKQDIKTAIENKGVDMTNTPFSEYSTKIDEITTGGGDTTNYSYKIPTADVNGLKAIGWNDESIGYFRDNNLCYDWQKDDYIVSEGNKELYGVITKDNISTYKSDPNFVYCPMIDTSNITNMNYIFSLCPSLQSLPLLDTSNVTNMSYMFAECNSLLSIPMLDTSNVTNMSNMFYKCRTLKLIPELNTTNVTNMSNMFYNCTSLHSIPLLDTSNVTDMNHMFTECNSLLSIPMLDTSNVININAMFSYCRTLQTIPELNTTNLTNMSNMFYECNSLLSIPMLDTSNVTNMSYMFYSCKTLQTIPELNTTNVANMNFMFSSCSSLQSLPLLDTSNVTNMINFFGYSTINTLTDLGGFKDLKISVTSGFLERTPNLTVDSLMNVINNVYDLTANGLSGQSLKFGSTNLNKLTAEQVAIATAKGWTLTA